MPKGQLSVRSQGYYRQSSATTPTTQYAPIHAHSLSSTHTQQNNYYSMPQPLPQSNNYTQQVSQNPYSTGGPVQHPNAMPHQSQYVLPLQAPASVPVSLRPSSGAWTPNDDSALMAARAQGMNWAPIQQKFFPSKTPNACRKRHERLMERRSNDDWDGIKMEVLAKGYMEMRKQIWEPLAREVGEKWGVVEAKCMSQGLKNLQNSARSYARRERMANVSNGTTQSHLSPPSNPYSTFEEDSGYADELEAEYDPDAASTSDRSSAGYSHQGVAGHSYSQSAGSQNSMASLMGNDARYNNISGNGRNERLPSISLDMSLGSIINRPSGGR